MFVAAGDALAERVELGELLLGFGEVLGGGEAIPVGGLGGVLGDTFSLGVHEAEVVLGPGEAIVGGALAPGEGLGDLVGGVEAEAEVGLGVGVSLLGGLMLPVGGLGFVLREAFAGLVQGAEDVLRFDVALAWRRGGSWRRPRRSCRLCRG